MFTTIDCPPDIDVASVAWETFLAKYFFDLICTNARAHCFMLQEERARNEKHTCNHLCTRQSEKNTLEEETSTATTLKRSTQD